MSRVTALALQLPCFQVESRNRKKSVQSESAVSNIAGISNSIGHF
jgi:hypothetical protein